MTLSNYCFRNFAVCLLLIASLAGCTRTGDTPGSNTDPGVTSGTGTVLQPEDPSTADVTSQDSESKPKDSPVVLFLGDSITAGYGIKEREAFPFLVGQRLAENGFPVTVRNAGVSGETTAGGLRRIDWVVKGDVDVLVIELGGNDGLRGVPVTDTKSNLIRMIQASRNINPEIRIVLAGMRLPPNMGTDYTTAFENIFPTISDELNVDLIPFVLDGVGGIPSLNQPDGIHPTAEGHKIVARNVEAVLKPIIEEYR